MDTGYPDSLMYGGKPQLHPVSSTSRASDRSFKGRAVNQQLTAAQFRRTPDPTLQREYSLKSGDDQKVLITTNEEDDSIIYDDKCDSDNDSFIDSCPSFEGTVENDPANDNGYDTDLEIDGEGMVLILLLI